jgi:hypothetical protein
MATPNGDHGGGPCRPTMALERWGILYCGGAQPVVEELHTFSEEFKISYTAESFGW